MNAASGKSLLVGIAGGASAGKTTFVKRVAKELGHDQALILPEESYYYDRSGLPEEERRAINFDHPDSIDFERMTAHLTDLRSGKAVPHFTYRRDECRRIEGDDHVEPKRVVLVAGILVLATEIIREMLDVKIYIDADSDLRFLRRLQTKLASDPASFEVICEDYMTKVKPMHLRHVSASRIYADVIVPEGGQ
ncbi:MAG: uridine kinase, partial [Gemmatimonadetes bacterium]|nr:uridine kinase [Gemmatimonadota bacterium]